MAYTIKIQPNTELVIDLDIFKTGDAAVPGYEVTVNPPGANNTRTVDDRRVTLRAGEVMKGTVLQLAYFLWPFEDDTKATAIATFTQNGQVVQVLKDTDLRPRIQDTMDHWVHSVDVGMVEA